MSLQENDPSQMANPMSPSVEPSAGAQASPAQRGRLAGIDTLRIVMAGIVVLDHFSVNPIFGLTADHGWRKVLRGVFDCCFNGQAAVIGFFLISGFCIHSAYLGSKKIHPLSYFGRREIRILVPVLFAFAIGFAYKSWGFVDVLWSLVCEEIYYLIYPAVLQFRRKYSWKPIFAVAGIGCAAVLAYTLKLHDTSRSFQVSGYGLTWLLGYPIWLAGCVLAEGVERWEVWTKPKYQIWIWRLGVWGLSAVFALLRFHVHGGTSNSLLLLLFAIPSYFWLKNEILYFQVYKPLQLGENLGKGSYSLYLTHMLAPAILGYSILTVRAQALPCGLAIVGSGILGTLFFLVIEKPSHTLARKLPK